MKRDVDAVVVGAGGMGRWHARAARRAGARRLVVVDVEPARAAALAARWPRAVVAPDLAAALAGDGLRVVHVCTPPASHAEIAVQALESGAHLVVEKPFAPSAAETGRLLALAEARRRLAVPVHQFLFQRGFRRALGRVAVLGPLRQVIATICSAGAAGGTPADADRVAAEILPHPLSLLARLLPGELDRARWQVLRPAPGEWCVAGVAGGTGVQIVVSMGGRPPVHELRLLGERGALHLDLFHGHVVEEGGAVSRRRKATRPLRLAVGQALASAANLARRAARGERAYPGLDALVGELYAAARDGGPPPIAAAETLAVATACDRVRAAAATG